MDTVDRLPPKVTRTQRVELARLSAVWRVNATWAVPRFVVKPSRLKMMAFCVGAGAATMVLPPCSFWRTRSTLSEVLSMVPEPLTSLNTIQPLAHALVVVQVAWSVDGQMLTGRPRLTASVRAYIMSL